MPASAEKQSLKFLI